jgi:hypothetical protein
MTALNWLLFAACAAAALLLVGYLYRKRETPGRGRSVLAAMRWAAIVLLILLAFDPELPAAGVAARARGTQVVVDASVSMRLPAGRGDASRWERAVQQARAAAGGRDVLLFGDEVSVVPADSLATVVPTGTASRLLPALQAAAEAGVRRVLVLTDGGIDDGPEISRWLARLGLDIDYRTVAEPRANVAIAELETPSWAEAGKPLEIRFGIAGVAAEGDTVDVSVLRDGQVLATETVVVPGQGRVAAGTLSLTPAAAKGGELVRFDLRLTGTDAAADDDARSTYVWVSDEPAGVALVSFRPDWEPRFLQPVLEQALGVPVRGYLRTRDESYIRTGTGLEAAERATEEDVRRVLGNADLVVLHGVDADAPAWAEQAIASTRRLLVLPAGETAHLPLPVQLGRAVPGDWYPSADVPPSPVASQLAGVDATSAPPLSGLHFTQAPAGAWVPLSASRGRRGPPTPLAVAGETAGRRWGVALGEGYWRWAFRGGESRQLYARLWGALAGWIVQEQGALAAAAVRPVQRVVPRGAPVRWVAPGLAPDSVLVRLEQAGGTSTEAVLPASADTATGAVLEPGHYRYEVRALAANDNAATAEGEITVESYSPEYTRPPVTLAMMEAAAVPVGPDTRARPGRPLHASAWPYVVIVLLIAAEWVLRRRWGLR